MSDVYYSIIFADLREEEELKLTRLVKLMSKEKMLPKIKAISVVNNKYKRDDDYDCRCGN